MLKLNAKMKKALVGGFAALTLGAGLATIDTSPAEARVYSRVGGGGGFARGGGFPHGGFARGGGGFVRHGGFAARPYYGGGYRRGYGYGGGAVAAGLVGGLALGALASGAYYGSPYYGYGYAPAYYGGGYGYAPASYYGGDCWIERRVSFTPWGERVVRRVQICN